MAHIHKHKMTHNYRHPGTSGYNQKKTDECKNVRLISSDVIGFIMFPFVTIVDKESECIGLSPFPATVTTRNMSHF